MIIVMCGTRVYGTQPALFYQLESERIPYIWHSIPDFTFAKKLLFEKQIADAYPNELLLFSDAWDVQLQNPDAIHNIDRSLFDKQMWLPADIGCWPRPEWSEQYPDSNSRWRFVNGSGPIGFGRDISSILEYGIKQYGLPTNPRFLLGTDQELWSWLYLNYPLPIHIDRDTVLTMTLSGADPGKDYHISDGKVVNSSNGNIPAFIHANGYSQFPKHMVQKGAEQIDMIIRRAICD